MKKKPNTARCSCCPYRFRLRKDGTVMKHTLYLGASRVVCEGGGRPPKQEP